MKTCCFTCNNDTLVSILSEQFKIQGYVEVYEDSEEALNIRHPMDLWLVCLNVPEDCLTPAGIKCEEGLPTEWVWSIFKIVQ